MSDEEIEETLGQLHIPAKLLEASNVGFRDRTKRRLSLPLSSIRDSRKSSIASASSGGKQNPEMHKSWWKTVPSAALDLIKNFSEVVYDRTNCHLGEPCSVVH